MQKNLGMTIAVAWENKMTSRVKGSGIRPITRDDGVVGFSSVSSFGEPSDSASDAAPAHFILQKHRELPFVVRARSTPCAVIDLCVSSTEDEREKLPMIKRLRTYHELYDRKPPAVVGPYADPTDERKPVAVAKHIEEEAIAEPLHFGTDSKDGIVYTPKACDS